MELSEFGYTGKWGALLLKYERGELQKPEVVDLLRSGEPVTLEAMPMLADIIENSGKSLLSHRARKWPDTDPKLFTTQQRYRDAAAMVEAVKSWINDPTILDSDSETDPNFRKRISEANKRANYKNRSKNKRTADAQAKEIVADFFGIKVRKLYDWISKAKR